MAASASPQASTPVPSKVKSTRIAFDHPVVVSGWVPANESGNRLELEFLPAGGTSWTALKATWAAHSGHYRVTARLRRSGYVRVVDVSAPATSGAPVIAHASAEPVEHVAVAPAWQVPTGPLASPGGRPVVVQGRLEPEQSGRLVRLEATTGHGWRTVARTHTRRHGAFALRFKPGGSTEWLRVRFSGDAANAPSSAGVGKVAVYSPSVASWYYDGGTTGCGFHAVYGVANRSLPCGTKVNFSFGGRTVTATVDDRGPYVGGRTWDLNQNTAGALGFGGVGTVWAAY